MNKRVRCALRLFIPCGIFLLFHPTPTFGQENPAAPPKPPQTPPTFHLNNVKGSVAEGAFAVEGGKLTNNLTVPIVVNGEMLAPKSTTKQTLTAVGFLVSILDQGTGCRQSGAVMATATVVPPLSSPLAAKATPVDTNITLDEIKIVDPTFIKQRLAQSAQALANVSPWNAAAITNQYGSIQGASNTNSYLSGQLTTAGQSQLQTTYNTDNLRLHRTRMWRSAPPDTLSQESLAGTALPASPRRARLPQEMPR